jgi:hypothetical protein
MTNIIKSVTIPYMLWKEFETVNPNINFSKWVRQQLTLWLRDAPTPPTLKPGKPRCKNNKRYKDCIITQVMCAACGVAECDDRLD